MISFIIYNINDERNSVVSSLKKQSNKDFEIIEVSDNNKYVAFNKGLEKSEGDFILFLESYDIIIEDAVEIICRNLKDKNTELLLFDYHIVYQDGYKERNYAYIYNSTHDQLRNHIINNYQSGVLWNKVFKQETIQRFNIRFDESNNYADAIFCVQFLNNIIKVSHIETSLIYHFIDGLRHTGKRKVHDLTYLLSQNEFLKGLKNVISAEKTNELLLQIKEDIHNNGFLRFRDFQKYTKTPIHLIWKTKYPFRIKLLLTFFSLVK